MKPLRIAILGTRGIPAAYGGFETFAEELSVRLCARGHAVTVYGRRAFGSAAQPDQDYRGVRCRTVPALMSKYLETPTHAISSFLDLFRQRFDVVLLCNAANSPFAWLVRVRGLPLAINVDGIERLRSKWNALGKCWYALGERCSVWFASRIVADAEVIARYYRDRYRIEPVVIAYGAEAKLSPPGSTLKEFNLSARNYLLYVSRFEPENNVLGVIEAYRAIPEAERTMPLVLVGDAPYAEDYKRKLKEAAVPGVVFTGFRFGAAYHELRTSAYAAVQATEVGGTHPALLEAMAYGNAVLANDVPEHREVLGEAGLYYPKNDFAVLSQLMRRVLRDPAEAVRLGNLAKKRAHERYQWDIITDQYEQLFQALV